jgi:hypothetical protein
VAVGLDEVIKIHDLVVESMRTVRIKKNAYGILHVAAEMLEHREPPTGKILLPPTGIGKRKKSLAEPADQSLNPV